MNRFMFFLFFSFLIIFFVSCSSSKKNSNDTDTSSSDEDAANGKDSDEIFDIDAEADPDDDDDSDGDIFEKPENNVVEISAGGMHTCQVKFGELLCWGNNTNGQLGDNEGGCDEFNQYNHCTKPHTSSAPVQPDLSGVLKNRNIVSVNAGYSHSCAFDDEGKIYCWGKNSNGQLGDYSKKDRLTPVKVVMAGNLKGRIVSSISAGFLHTCASTTEGKGFCWGSNMYDQLGDNRVFESDLPLEINTYGALKGKTISSTVAGTNITCAIDNEGLVSCWGEEWGEEEMKSSYIPVPFSVDGVPSEKTVVSMDTEGYRICVLDSLGLVSCGTSCSSKDICRFATLFDSKETRFKKISVGHYHSCAISDKNKVYCWGGNRYGQTGSNTEEQDVDFSEVYSDGVLKDKKIVSVSAGWLYSCAADDKGAAYCWGMNNFGQLGVESSEKTFEPVAVDTTGELKDSTVSILNTGFYHSCILDDKNRIICWGRNNYGQVGDMTMIKRELAFKSDVSGKIVGTISSISGGREHTCILNDKGKIYCWGNNLQGQLGNGKGGCVEEPETQKCIPNYTHEPVEVDMTGVLKDKTVVSICAGSAHSCALDNEGAVYCWGLNGQYGALGNGSDQDSFVPSKVDASGVLFEKTIKEISCGSGRNCVLDSEGKVYCWGLNDVYGGLGAGSGPDSSVPVAVNTDGALSNRTVVSISSGWEHTCVLTSDKIIFCWGYNLYGMLGTGTTNRSPVPIAVTMAGIIEGDIISVEAGGYHTCALSSKNKIYCWGRNEEGQIGNGGEESRYLIPQPVKMTGVLNDKKIVEISTGFMHTCAKDNEGKIYCWGGDWFGQLGNAAMQYSHVPVAVEYK